MDVVGFAGQGVGTWALYCTMFPRSWGLAEGCQASASWLSTPLGPRAPEKPLGLTLWPSCFAALGTELRDEKHRRQPGLISDVWEDPNVEHSSSGFICSYGVGYGLCQGASTFWICFGRRNRPATPLTGLLLSARFSRNRLFQTLWKPIYRTSCFTPQKVAVAQSEVYFNRSGAPLSMMRTPRDPHFMDTRR